MNKIFKIQIAASLLAVMAIGAQANAATLVLSGPSYSANLIWNNDGTVSLSSAPTVDYTAVQQQDKLWSNFTSGSSLPAGAEMVLSFASSGGFDHHSATFDYAFGALGGSITWGYDLSVLPGNNFVLKDVASDILQTVGSATLVKTLVDNNSNTYTLNFTQNGNTVSGITSATFLPGATMLSVSETLTISGAFGSDATGVSNSFVEAAVPEPATWLMMALGFAGLGFAGLRRTKAGSTSFAG